jgi:hypothetical protein
MSVSKFVPVLSRELDRLCRDMAYKARAPGEPDAITERRASAIKSRLTGVPLSESSESQTAVRVRSA